jgi:beta-lactamase class A
MQSAAAVKWSDSADLYRATARSPRVFNRDILISGLIVMPFIIGVLINLIIHTPLSPRPALAATSTLEQPALKPEKSAPVAPAPIKQVTNSSQQLQTLLNEWSQAHSSQRWSVSVSGLGDDSSSASLNPNTAFPTASIFKLFLTYQLFKTYSMADLDKVNLSVKDRGTQSLKTCVELMLRVSDNACGEAIGNKLGWNKTTRQLKALGLPSTNLNNPSGPASTAADAALFLQKLYAGQLFDSSAQQYVMSLLQQQKFRGGIPAGCASCTVANKTGDLDFVRHDVGIVQYSGGVYVLAIFTNGASYNQIAELSAKIQAIMMQS